jgi:putative phosphoribosyl transferase
LKDLALSPVKIPVDVGHLEGLLSVPADTCGLVLFAHGRGSSHERLRNNFIASALQQRGIATLLFDLLTPVEDSRYSNRFNINLLSERLELATDWLLQQQGLTEIAIGYMGAGTGAAAALRAGAHRGEKIKAIVARGGRPDLAGPGVLTQVTAPTLLLVGGRDTPGIALNREAIAHITCEKQMRVVAGATHLFEEPGTLEQIATHATNWFGDHFKTAVSG